MNAYTPHEPISPRDEKGVRALNAYRDIQAAGLSSSEFRVLSVRIRHYGAHTEGITWTGPEEMTFLSGVKDPKAIRDADRALVKRGILSVARPARIANGKRYAAEYHIHFDRLAAIADERWQAFLADKRPRAVIGRPPKSLGDFPPAFPEKAGGFSPKDSGKFPPHLRTSPEDVQASGSATHRGAAAPRASERSTAKGNRAASQESERAPKQRPCAVTGARVPAQVSPATWARAVATMAAPGRLPPEKRVLGWLKDANAAIRAGRDPDLVLTNAVRCGLHRPNPDPLPGWRDTLSGQPPSAITGTLLWRYPIFDHHADALFDAVRTLKAEGYSAEDMDHIAGRAQSGMEGQAPEAIADDRADLSARFVAAVRALCTPAPAPDADFTECEDDHRAAESERFHAVFIGEAS